MAKSGRQIEYPGMHDTRRTGIQVRHTGEGREAKLAITIPAGEYTPKRAFFVDYAEVKRGIDGVRLLFGKRDPFAPADGRLHFALEVSFPNAAFCNQLYKSLLEPAEPGGPLFIDSLRNTIAKNGYGEVRAIAAPPAAEKQGHLRANAAMMVVFEDDACIDFLYLDAMTLHMASKGKDIRDVGDVVRVVMAPNVLLYFVERVKATAKEMLAETPGLDRQAEAP